MFAGRKDATTGGTTCGELGFLSLATFVGVIGLVAAGCAPLVHAPPGGGAVTTGTYRIGPFNLAAMGQTGSESNATAATSRDRRARSASRRWTSTSSTRTGPRFRGDMAHLHHVLLMDPADQDVLCPSRAERFSGAGAERTPLRLPDSYAYLVGQSDQWNALWHVMNLSDQAMSVYIQYKVGYQTGANATNTRGVRPYFMDVTGCGNSEFDVPGNGGPGSEYLKSKTWAAPTSGIAVYAGGHLHGGGMDITLSDDTTKFRCVMTAHYDPMMSGMDMMNFPESIDPCPMHNQVIQGWPYTVTARYDNSQPVHGGHGDRARLRLAGRPVGARPLGRDPIDRTPDPDGPPARVAAVRTGVPRARGPRPRRSRCRPRARSGSPHRCRRRRSGSSRAANSGSDSTWIGARAAAAGGRRASDVSSTASSR